MSEPCCLPNGYCDSDCLYGRDGVPGWCDVKGNQFSQSCFDVQADEGMDKHFFLQVNDVSTQVPNNTPAYYTVGMDGKAIPVYTQGVSGVSGMTGVSNNNGSFTLKDLIDLADHLNDIGKDGAVVVDHGTAKDETGDKEIIDEHGDLLDGNTGGTQVNASVIADIVLDEG